MDFFNLILITLTGFAGALVVGGILGVAIYFAMTWYERKGRR